MHRFLFVFIFSSSCFSISNNEYESFLKRVYPEEYKEVVVKVPKNCTVAQFLTSQHSEHVGFNTPLVPRFSKRYPFTWMRYLKDYDFGYPLLSGAVITAAAMERFMYNAHLLFHDQPEKMKQFRSVLDRAINAMMKCLSCSSIHIKCLSCNSTHIKVGLIGSLLNCGHYLFDNYMNYGCKESFDANLKNLNGINDEIYDVLNNLSLSDFKVRHLVEKILSTSHSSTANYKFMFWPEIDFDKKIYKDIRGTKNVNVFLIFLYKLLKRDYGDVEGVRIGTVWLIFTSIYIKKVLFYYLCIVVSLYVASKCFQFLPYRKFFIPVAGLLFFLNDMWNSFFKDLLAGEYNTVPEKDGGIKVTIELVDE
ncbi:hypothetical protein FJ366_02100 [Candidatus Dependentiae bacterium]|nr:hypothetical protein [Candidatus Dependentiae bacterium]